MLLDTDILIDYLRLFPLAIEFIEALDKKDRCVSALTHLELLQGCSTKEKSQTIDHFLKQFKTIPLNETVSQSAVKLFREHKWHSHMSIPDVLIAATALDSDQVLVTRNLKDYRMIPGLKLNSPY